MNRYYRLFVVLVTLLAVFSIVPAQAQTAAPWAPNVAYSVNTLVTYNGATYKCLQAHTSLTGWEPPNVPALWALQTTSPTATRTNTVAPTRTNTPGSTAVTRTPTRTSTRTNTPGGPTATRTNTRTATRTITATSAATRTNTRVPVTNTAPPASNTPSGIAPWAPNTPYTVGQLVTYNGQTYKCINPHTSLVGWEPPNVPSLWQLQTTVPTNTPAGPTSTPGGPTVTPGGVPQWTVGTAYKVGDVVMYAGKTYKCISAHTAIAGWEPASSPTLWSPYIIPTNTATRRPTITPGGPTLTPTATAMPGSRVVAYFAQWGIYERAYYVKNIDTSGSASVITHLNYAFGNISTDLKCYMENRLGWGDSWADFQRPFDASLSVDGVADSAWDQPLKGNFNQLKKLKAKYPHIKILISLGGWTWSGRFSDAALPANRVAFVKSCIDLYIRGNLPTDGTGTGGVGAAAGIFDGIDIDWEYPAMPAFEGDPARGIPPNVYRPEDTVNFTALLVEFRKQLNELGADHDRHYLLTIAAPAGQDKIDKIEVNKIGQYLDFINLMTYDFHGGWEATGPTNFHSPLYGSPNDPSTGVVKNYNTDYAVNRYLQGGIPSTKLLIGVPFYGRGWDGVPNVNNGVYQSATGPAKAVRPYQDDAHAGVEDYKYLKALGYPSFFDATTGSYYIYNGSSFWSYDDPANITRKMTYIKTKQLGGAMAWALDGDAGGELMRAIGNGLR